MFNGDEFLARNGEVCIKLASSWLNRTGISCRVLSFTTLGVRGERAMTLGVMDATLTGMAGWRHAFGHTSPGKTYAFSAGDAFPLYRSHPVLGMLAVCVET
ncbi:hypothetical protein GOB08_18950 [Sinorhizobium meliloti]|nr:hypothetical protein [Sinorhizobium meliloti]